MSQGWGQPPGYVAPGYVPPAQSTGGSPGHGFGAPPAGYGVPPGGYGGPPTSPSGMAIAALIMGVGAWVFGGLFLATPAVIVAKMELNRIERGESPEAGRTFATIGWWAGLANLVFSLLAIFAVCVIYAVMIGLMAGTHSGGY